MLPLEIIYESFIHGYKIRTTKTSHLYRALWQNAPFVAKDGNASSAIQRLECTFGLQRWEHTLILQRWKCTICRKWCECIVTHLEAGMLKCNAQ